MVFAYSYYNQSLRCLAYMTPDKLASDATARSSPNPPIPALRIYPQSCNSRRVLTQYAHVLLCRGLLPADCRGGLVRGIFPSSTKASQQRREYGERRRRSWKQRKWRFWSRSTTQRGILESRESGNASSQQYRLAFAKGTNYTAYEGASLYVRR